MSTPRYGLVPASWLRPEVGAFGFAVLSALATHANRDGVCTVRQGSLAEGLGVSRQRVCREVGRLAELGELELEARHDRDGWQLANTYRLPAVAALHTGCREPRHQEHSPVNTALSAAPARPDDQAGKGEKLVVPAADWQPDAQDLAWLAEARPDLDAGALTTKFLVWARRDGRRFADVSAAWRKWALDEREPRRRSAPTKSTSTSQDSARPPAPPSSAKDRLARAPGLKLAWFQAARRQDPDLPTGALHDLARWYPLVEAEIARVGLFQVSR